MRGSHVRQANLSAVLRRIHAEPSTRAQLSEATGLTRTAIASLVSTLAGAGLVVERDAVAGGGPGRPSPLVSPADGAVSVGVELDVESVAVTVVDLGGAVLSNRRIPRVEVGPHPEDAVAVAALVAREALAAGGSAGRFDVLGVRVAVAGVVDRQAWRVVVAPNLGWFDVPIGRMVGEVIDRRLPVAVANDADLGMLAECARGAATGRRDVVYVSGGTGVGGGALVDGTRLRGSAGFDGEIGHVPVNPKGARCRCGSRGCLESEVGEGAVLRRARRRRSRRGRADLDALVSRALAGTDAVAVESLTEAGRWLGVGLSGVINVLNPERVVLGGFFAAAFPLLRTPLLAELDRRVLAPTRAAVDVVPAALGPDAALLGAAELGFEAVLADPLGRRR